MIVFQRWLFVIELLVELWNKQIKVSRFSRFIDMYPQYWTPSIGGTYHFVQSSSPRSNRQRVG